jgi:hypothetical protein
MEVEDSEEDSEEEGEVDLREELISALEELRIERKKIKSLKEELKEKEGSQNSNSKEVEQMITKLKIQVEEDKRIKEALRGQLDEKDKMIEGLEAEIVTLRKDLQKKDMQQNNTKVLDEIISSQRPYHEKYGLGYNQTEKGSSSKTTKQRSYAEIVRGSSKKEEGKRNQEEDYRYTAPPRRFIFQNQQQPTMERPREEEGFRRETPFRRSSTPRYQTIFLGLCYSCNNFGHKVVNCRANTKNINNYEGYTRNGYSRRSHEAQSRSYNIFESLSTEVECYKCNNFGHMAKDCRLIVPPRESQQNINSHRHEPQRIWIRKQDQFNTEECMLSLQAKHKRHGWYVDSGCSKHMTGDMDRFLTLKKERDGSVSFGNDNSTIIIGKGTVKLGSKDAKEENVLLVEDMKHNLLSVSQMCDQGHRLVFDSQKCEIRKAGSDKLVATTVRTPSNIYVLNEIGKEKCFLRKGR